MTDYLIGFYRRNNKIEAIYSTQQTFYDTTLKDTIIPTLVPLTIRETQMKWDTPIDLTILPKDIQNILSSHSILITSQTEDSPYWILMYVPEKTPTMSRGGILVKKENGIIKPITVTLNDHEYVIDIKGSGCPTGGFPNAHFRVQAGSITGFHVRVTGGLATPGATKEYTNLLNIKSTIESLGEIQEIQALGIHHFKLHFGNQDESFSQLLRLSPSSIRFSFKQNPVLDALNTADEHIGIFCAGKEGSKLLEHTPPLLHRNCSWNNLVYVKKDTYVLTDYEEADHAHISHCNLELINAFYPYYFNNTYYQTHFFNSYLDGLKSLPSKTKHIITENNPTTISNLNDLILRSLVHPYIFQRRLTEKTDLGFVDDTISYVRSFLPDSYYQSELSHWANTKCRYYLNIKKALLSYYSQIRDHYGFETLRQLWEERCPDHRLQEGFEVDINSIEKNIRKLVKLSKIYHQKDLGKYKSEFHLITLFYDVPPQEDWLDRSIKNIDTVLIQLDHFIQTQTLLIPNTYVTDSIESRREHLYDNIIAFVFPIIPFLMVHYQNERALLLSMRQRYPTNNSIATSLGQIEERINLISTTPCQLHDQLRHKETILKDLFILDYMN